MAMVSFAKVLDVRNPKRNNMEDAGIDLYVPKLTKEFIELFNDATVNINNNNKLTMKSKNILVKAHEDVLIPMGVKSKFERGLYLRATAKSGVCTNKKLILGANVIDPSYQGVIFGHLINFSNNDITIDFDEKCFQVVPEVYYDGEFDVFNTDKDFYKNETERGEGALGHQGNV